MPGETRYLFFVSGAEYHSPQPAVPSKRFVNVYYLPRLKTDGVLGVSLFEHQSDARAKALANAKAEAPA